MKFAAIDIGSNAMRLLLVNVTIDGKKTHFHKMSLFRSPVRLGVDTFRDGKISAEKQLDLEKTLVAYRNLMDVFKVLDYRCYATSAMRDAENGAQVAEEVSKASGIKVEVITGDTEAHTIFSTHIADELDPDASYLYIDVGGGSCELTLFSEGKLIDSESFRLGTIRLLENLVQPEEWTRLKNWIADKAGHIRHLEAIGSGGNINKLAKLCQDKGKDEDTVQVKKLEECYEYLKKYSYEERVNILGLRDDRADVIIPAAEIYLYVLKQAGIKRIYVPKIGLSDGMIHVIYEKYIQEHATA